MHEICFPSLGETWLAVLREVYQNGETVGGETRELLHLSIAFKSGEFQQDPLLARFGSLQFVDEMRKVFFSNEPNQLGHNYRDKIRGPRGQNDLSDVIELLRLDPWSKRAAVTFIGSGDGQVPCINVIHFIRRGGGLVAAYFSRGQDIFQKFYADGVCLYEMANRVASRLDIPLLSISGTISSAHIYIEDSDKIQDLLDSVDSWSLANTNVGIEA